METTLCLCHAWGVWCGCKRLACPDQYLAILIDGQPVPLDELNPEVLQCLGIEVELPLEGAIGHAAPLAQQGDHLIHDRDKVHPVSSLPGAQPPYSCTTPS